MASPDVPFYQWNSDALTPSSPADIAYQNLGLPTVDQLLNPTIPRPSPSPLLGSGVLAPEFQHLAGKASMAGPDPQPGFWSKFRDSFIGTKDQPGWGGLAIGGANSLLQGYLGMRQYALAKKQLAEGQRQFNLNYEAQRKLTNSQLEDRQRALVASGNSAYESVDSYMNKYGI